MKPVRSLPQVIEMLLYKKPNILTQKQPPPPLSVTYTDTRATNNHIY